MRLVFLVGKLTPDNRVYVMNAINALLFSQQSHQEEMNNNIAQKLGGKGNESNSIKHLSIERV